MASEHDIINSEHDQTAQARRVTLVDDSGAPISVGTSSINYIQSSEDATYKYYGYASDTGWKFKRKTLATGVWEVASGAGDYDTAWADRANKTYNYT